MNNLNPASNTSNATENETAPVDRAEGLAPGEAGDTPSDSVIEKPDEILPGDKSPQDTAPTRST